VLKRKEVVWMKVRGRKLLKRWKSRKGRKLLP
jgi:hypothetical protein